MQGAGVTVTEHRAGTEREHGRHPAAARGKPAVADRVNPVVDPVKPSRSYPASDHRVAPAEHQQLGNGDHAVLTYDEICEGSGEFVVHMTNKSPDPRSSPPQPRVTSAV